MSLAAVLSYAAGECTRGVASLLNWVQPGWGNAADWLTNASKAGYATSSTPVPGSIAVWGAYAPGTTGSAGHVAVVDSVNQQGQVTVTEMNDYGVPGGGWNKYDITQLSAYSQSGIKGYILPPGMGAASGNQTNQNWWNTWNPAAGIPLLGEPFGSPTPKSNPLSGASFDAIGQFFTGLPGNLAHLMIIFGLILLGLVFVMGGLGVFVLQSGAARKL